uniref:ZP domain-containing protein n=1 Tax=Panagrellus redivivus TaxID=6233 RepID=A0A7E4UUC3_PANRE
MVNNGILGEPKATCGGDDITVHFETELPFSGNVYAKGFFDNKNCRVNGDGVGNTINITIPISSDCGMRRRRRSNPTGVTLETTVVIMFHKMFLTRSDKAFHIDCTYQQSDEAFTQRLDVSALPTTDIPKSFDMNTMMPKCSYQVLTQAKTPLQFAAVGQSVFHKWTCGMDGGGKSKPKMKQMHCLTVHTCVVDDGQGATQVLLDDDGLVFGKIHASMKECGFRCPTDPLLLDHIEYTGDLEAGREGYVFKFADKPTVYFSCQLRVEMKVHADDNCIRTSDTCNGISPPPQRSPSPNSIEIDPDFPRPSTPAFEFTTSGRVTSKPNLDNVVRDDIIDEEDDDDDDLVDGFDEDEEANSYEMVNVSDIPDDGGDDDKMPKPPVANMMNFTKKRTKHRRFQPIRRSKDDILLPDVVAVHKDLTVRPLQPSIEMDVSAGAVDVIEMPEIAVTDSTKLTSENTENKSPTYETGQIVNNVNVLKDRHEICIPRTLIASALLAACFILVTLILACLCVGCRISQSRPKPIRIRAYDEA